MPSPFDLANQIAIALAGHRPEWVEQTTPTDAADYPLDSAASGAELFGSLRTLFDIRLRENQAYRTARFAFSHDAGTTYTIEINGVANIIATPDTLSNLRGLMVAEINDNVGDYVTAALDPDNSSGIIVTGDTPADFNVDKSVAGGAGTITCVVDPKSATARLWCTEAGSNEPSGWVLLPEGEVAVTSFGVSVDRWTAGRSRVAVQLVGAAGAGDGESGITYATTDRPIYIGPTPLQA